VFPGEEGVREVRPERDTELGVGDDEVPEAVELLPVPGDHVVIGRQAKCHTNSITEKVQGKNGQEKVLSSTVLIIDLDSSGDNDALIRLSW
jgi:hypothetical protein